jgi:hypothetical protein
LEKDRVLARRTFLKRAIAITGGAAIGLLLDACSLPGGLGGGAGGNETAALAEAFKGVTPNGNDYGKSLLHRRNGRRACP